MFFIIFLFMAYIKSRVYIVFVVGCLAASFFPIFPIEKSICHYKTDKKRHFYTVCHRCNAILHEYNNHRLYSKK